MIVGGSDPKAEGKVDTGIPVASGAASAQVAPVIDTPPVEKVKPVANEYDALLDAAPSNEYDAIIENGLGDQGAALKTAMKTAQDTVPDQYKKAKDLSERTGIPVDSVERNLQAVEKQAPWLSNEYDDLLKDSPTTAAFLAEKDHAKLAKDDIKPLSVLEQIARMEEDDRWLPSNMGKIFMGGLANTNRSIAQIPAAAFSAVTLPGNLLAKATGTGQVAVPDWLLNNPAAEYFKRAVETYSVEEMQGNAWEDLKTGDLKKASRVLAAQIISNAPSQFVAVGSAAMGLPTAGLTFMGATSGASQLSKNADAAKAQEYDKDPAQTAMDMLMNGGIEVLGERYGTFGIFKVIEKSVAKQFGKATAKTLVAEVGKNIALAFGGEGLEEFSTQLGQDLSDYATGNPRALDGTFSRAANAFLVGAGSGLSITSPTAIYSGLVKSHHLNMDQKFWDNFTGTIADKVNGSKLRERDPGAFEIHVGKVLEDSGKPTKLYVSPEAVRQFFQVDGRVDEAAYNNFIDEMQIRDQLQEAAAAGKDFEISAAKFATKYAGSDLSTALKPDIRFSPDGMTLKESEMQREVLARNVEEMRAEYATMVEENRLPAQAQGMREKLMLPKAQGGFGLKAEDADANMLVFMAGAKALSKDSGETVDAWFARVNPVLNVGGQYVEGSLAQTDNQETAKSQIRQTTLQKIKALYGGEDSAINGFLAGTVNPAAIKKGAAAKENLLKLRDEMRAEQGRVDARQGELFQKDTKQTETPAFKAFFKESKVVDENGAPKVVYHGTKRPDRIGNVFKSSRATSGPMAYFTDNPEVASNYALGKQDTSLANEDVHTYEKWFRLKIPGTKNAISFDRAWHFLTAEEKKTVLERAPHITSNDQQEIVYDATATRGNGGYNLEYHRGDALKALVDAWLDSGALFNDEFSFYEVLRMAGLDTSKIEMHDPHAEFPTVIPVYLSIQNPLVTTAVPAELIAELEAVAKRRRPPTQKYGADFWDKRTRYGGEWVDVLKKDIAEGNNSFVWTSIPDWVTTVLKRNGYDGIHDVGGKSSGVGHDVWIPFKSNQVKSALGNRGTFNESGNIFKQDTGAVRGSVQFTNSATLINLFQNADYSTFLHETAHIFVNEMGKLVASGQATTFMQDDYETLKAYAGDINSVEGQEKIARAFEAYLREGKAPSLKLVQAFRRFKQWLTAIYRAVAGLNVEVTPEVKQVFDRLLASETEIQEAERFYGMKRSLVDLIPTDPARKTAVKQLQFNAEQTALERQAKTLLRAYLEATGGRAAIRAQAEKEIDAMPVYKALKMALERGGIDSEALVAFHGKDAVEALKRKFPGVFKRVSVPKGRTFDQEVRSRGGIDPKTMGEYEIQTFNEQKGSKGILRKGGGAWDDMAASLQEEGLLQVPDNRNASDYLRELVEQKKEIPAQKEVDPQERTTIHELAVELNYASPEALVYDLTISPRRSEAVSTRAREIMQQKEQEILSDIQKQELLPGEEAVHSDATITYLIAEMEVLGEKIDRKRAGRPAVVEQKAYRAAAAEVIGRKKVSLAGRYDLYASAEQRYAKQAYAFMEQGDFANAFEAKRKQILNHMMVQEAIKARDEKIAIERSFRPKKFKARLNNVENAFADAAIDLAGAYGLSDMEAKAEDPLSALADADETLESMIPDWIRAKAKAGDYRNLTMAELRELDGAIGAVLSFGSDVMKSIEAGEMKTLQEWTEASMKEMENLKDRTESGLQKYRDESSKWSKFFHTVDAFVSSTTLTQMLTDWMDNFSFLKTGNAGPFKRLYNKVLGAEVEFNSMKTEVMQATKKAWATLGAAAERIHKQYGTQITIPGVEMSEDMKRTNRAFWSVNRMIALLLNTGNTGNLEVTKRGLGFTDAQIQKVAAMFTAEELQAIQEIWNATDILFPKLDATHFAIYNRNVAKVEAAPVRFTSLDGQVVELKGGYYPLVFDHALNDRAAQFQEDDLMKNQTAAVIRSVKPSDGMTKGRVEGHSLPPMLDTAVWFTHIDRTARYISHARILRDLNRFTRNKDWSREFKKKAGDAHYKTLRSWLQHNANPGRKLMNGPLDRAASYLKSTATAAVLGFKVAVGLKQRVALINTAQALGRGDARAGWSWILKAYKDVDYRTSVAGVSNGATWEAILKKSSYLKTRDGNIDREISDLRRGIDPFAKKITIKGRDFTAKDIQDFAFEWIKMNDRSVVAITWTAAVNQYMQEKADGLPPEEAEKAAIAYADGIVQDTQASSLTPELSEMQRQEGWLRLFTSFMTSAINYGNRVVQNHRAWTSGAITNKEYMNHVMHEVIAFPWVTLLISEAFRGKLPEWWDFLLAPFEAFTSFMPVIRDVFAYKYGKGVGDSPIFELPRRTVRAVADIPKLMTGDKDFLAFLWDVGRAAEAYFKVPALNFVKDVKTVFDNITEG